MFKAQSLGLNPIVDYVLPVWPSINCFNPVETDNSKVEPSDSFQAYLSAVEEESARHPTSGLFFTAQCVHLHGPCGMLAVLVCSADSNGHSTVQWCRSWPANL